ncbi:hypothetical protein FNF27_04103 [Cafeteria roenbergensis]|uniref:Ion transport domain-containing protein n=1 Tax=Cafeteria roenbergensis TaxID=33653 RepID=A0A5A8ECN4_CAFRO|nr:hypothetical protein FNF27_04103 [Cafeteria roenbergensis]
MGSAGDNESMPALASAVSRPDSAAGSNGGPLEAAQAARQDAADALLPRKWALSQWLHVWVSGVVEDWVTSQSWFRSLVFLAIMANTVSLAAATADDGPDRVELLTTVNYVCTWVFVAETLLKLCADGLHGYFSQGGNVLDFVVVLASLVELGFTGTGATLAAFRAIRAARVLRVANSSKSMRRLLAVVASVGPSVLWLAVLLALMLLVMALLGRSLFAGAFDEALARGGLQAQADDAAAAAGMEPAPLFPRGVPVLEEPPRVSFDTLDQAFFTTFVVLAAESWNEVSRTLAFVAGPASLSFLAFIQVAGNFLLLNVFTALLLAAFESQRDSKEAWHAEVEGTAEQFLSLHVERSKSSSLGAVRRVSQHRLFASQRRSHSSSALNAAGPEAGQLARPRGRRAARPSIFGRRRQDAASAAEAAERNLCIVPRGSLLQRCAARAVLRSDPFSGEQFGPMCSLWLCGRRLQLYSDSIIILLIVAGSVLVAVDHPTAEFSPESREAIAVTEVVFTAIFVAEILCSLVARGALLHPEALWRSAWSVLDTVVVAVSAAALIVPAVTGGSSIAESLGWAAALRSVRALRPLRVIARNRGIKVVLNALLSSLPALGSTVAVLSFGMLLFAIAGVQLFAGAFRECNDPDFPPGAPFAGVPVLGPAAANASSPAAWSVLPCAAPFTFEGADGVQVREVVRSPDAPYAFDNLWEGLLTVFVAASGEGWPATMWRAQDITGDGLQPQRRANPMFSVFWVALIVVLEWFLTQLFIGAVFEEFIKLKRREETGIAALSARQKQFLAGQRFLAGLLPVRLFDDPDHACRQTARRLADSSAFRFGVRVVIAINVASQLASVPDAPRAYHFVLDVIGAVCAAIFVLEALVEIAGRGLRQVLSSPWAVFDLVVAAGAALELVLLASAAASPGWVRLPLQLLRVSRAIRLAREIPGVRAMILALWGVRATILSIGGLLLLLLAVAAAVAMNVFGGRAFTATLGPHGNFKDFPAALLTLLRMLTGEGWEGVMGDIMNAPADPLTGEEPSEFGKAAVVPFFTCFVVLFSFLFVALFLILVVEAYSEMDDQRRSSLKNDVDAFRAAWAAADPEGTKWIPFWRLEATLRSLPAPFGVGRNARFPELLHFTRRLQIRAYNGHVYFRELLLALHRHTYGVGMPSSVLDALDTAPHAVRKRLRTKLLHRLVDLASASAASVARTGDRMRQLVHSFVSRRRDARRKV